MLIGALVAIAIGLPALRIRGLYLAVTTIAFAVALDSYFLNPVNFPDLVPSTMYPVVLWKRFDLSSPWARYELILGIVIASALVVRAVRRTRAGRAMIGTRDNERAAGALSIPTTKVKLQTFVFAGGLAGLAGGLYVLALTPVTAGQGTFPPGSSIEVFSYAVIGGLGTIAGAVSGVLFFHLLDHILGQWFDGDVVTMLRYTLSGAGLLWILYFLPGGLWQLVQRFRDRVLRNVAERHGLLVPSLVADKRVEDEPDEDHAEDETDVIAGALS